MCVLSQRGFVRLAEAAEDSEGFGAVVWGHVRERLLDRRAGMGQVRAGQVAEPGEVAGAGGVIGRVRGHGRHRVRSVARLAHEEWTAYPKATPPARPASSAQPLGQADCQLPGSS